MNFSGLSNDDKLDIRAAQRTFQGAYYRTALGQLGFALVVLKLFNYDFLAVGSTFTAQGCLILLIGHLRSRRADEMIHSHDFETSGNTVMMLFVLNLTCYVTLVYHLLRV
ncbi:hypothetical protein B0I72DRAFT_136183 [Yarrowia lipolytica]|jgi:uncharacterized membrane protein YidH (DUF202 family)|uniref:YALI0D14586p n=2 Tax=Yarrowia lipolytica TaxID=4952 RepID=Q6C934_YARLI|nr:YALI0D14586p [Yarrowia lipolytica CLIB122]AOW04066.1 hypothetical protein YALI1_D17829g [Yarrowia lipolytica]KAB8285122.1 hypothetical protein BKA91DRAFT_133852 [Yarrowia lipolytica]KAE8171452.1 hypothetical protein BKA90DRAFT_139016 [Yarrowia lipolytica]KAJ8054386.1 hypothetical protein LXG23DRAFT_55945 [Yarrowia lipolytica]QNP97851.1 Hypothetical protein YALI2_D00292g [Yarrowia lipolytica]|eukprot:XP_502828.1 YALI0D14586p [Yarrowia lipolytica CLIB122]